MNIKTRALAVVITFAVGISTLYSGGGESNTWGVVVSGAQMSLRKQELNGDHGSNTPISLVVTIRNVSTNEFLLNALLPPIYFSVTDPSGKTFEGAKPSARYGTNLWTGSVVFKYIKPDSQAEFPYKFEKIWKVSEPGVYKIIAHGQVAISNNLIEVSSVPLNVLVSQQDINAIRADTNASTTR